MKPAPETLSGCVVKTFTCNPTFTAGRLRIANGTIVPFAGAVCCDAGDHVTLVGEWTTHEKFGRQFKVDGQIFDAPMTTEGLAAFLANCPEFKGIGSARAQLLAFRFGADTESFERALRETPELMAETANCSVDVIHSLGAKWAEHRGRNAIMASLSGYGLTHHQCKVVVEAFGNSALTVLQRDPYVLCRELDNFGFRRADEIAMRFGVAKSDASRLRAAITYTLTESVDSGSTWMARADLLDAAGKVATLDCQGAETIIDTAIGSAIELGQLCCETLKGEETISLPSLRRQEFEIAGFIAAAAGRPGPRTPGAPEELEAAVASVAEDDRGRRLNPEQLAAVRTSLASQWSVITGGAGCGKTFTVRAILQWALARGLMVAQAAPTGKAARRLNESTGYAASTIHRLLGYDPVGKGFCHNPGCPLPWDLLVIDEVSMLDVPLGHALLSAVDWSRTTIVFVGDHHQLPPVGPGNILRDIMTRRLLPITELRTVVRQAGRLKVNSSAILDGHLVTKDTYVERTPRGFPTWAVIQRDDEPEAVAEYIVEELFGKIMLAQQSLEPVSDIQVLTPRKSGLLGVDDLNRRLQRLIQRQRYGVEVAEPEPGRRLKLLVRDKVLCTRNNYGVNVMNGEVGVVIDVDHTKMRVEEVGKDGVPRRIPAPKGSLLVEFPAADGAVRQVVWPAKEIGDLQLAYAMTIHKMQGSEIRCAVVVCHKQHAFQHHRSLIYTAATRAKEICILVGDPWGLRNAVVKVETDKRRTFLQWLPFEHLEQNKPAQAISQAR